ncbi:MAG: hypothetical protein ACK52L_23830 [Pirellula sp.]
MPCLYSMIGGFGLWWDGILIPTWFITHLAAIASVAGLVGKSWLAGLFAGVLGFVLFAGLSLMGMSIGSSGSSFFIFGITLDQEPFSALCIAFVVPWIVIVCSLPLYLTRFLLGWRFSFGLATAKREPLVVVDFFLLMTSVACALWMTTAPRLVLENGNELSSILTLTGLGLVWGAFNALVVLPSAYFAFRIKSYWTAGVLSFLASMLAPLVLAIIYTYSMPSNFVFILLPSVFACSIFTLALILLRRIGFVLQRYEPKSATAKLHVPLKDVEEFEPTQRFFQSVHFRWTALFAIITLVLSFTIVAIRTHRKNVDQSLAALRHSLGEQGVAIETRNREVVSLVFAPNADRRLLESFEPKLKIKKISLSGGPLPQDFSAMLARYPNLSSLDLSNTGLNESQLNELNFTWRYPSLVHLSIAGNPLTPESILRLLGSGQTLVYHRLRSIDLSNLGLKDEDLSVVMLRYRSLNLSRNQITDKGLADFLRLGGGHYQKLDVSGNPIDGSEFSRAFSQIMQVNELILDGCPLTDSSFSPALLQFQNSTKLILKNTQLTDSYLVNFGTNIYRLELGDGNFTDKGISDFLVNATSLYDLSLTGKQFTGACFRDWQQNLSFLSMKGSGLVDENVGSLPTVFGTLNLSDTALTDIGLEKLKPNVYSIDLSNTAVTVKGILNCPLPPRCNIRLSQGQFSSQDIELLRTKYIIALDPIPEQY